MELFENVGLLGGWDANTGIADLEFDLMIQPAYLDGYVPFGGCIFYRIVGQVVDYLANTGGIGHNGGKIIFNLSRQGDGFAGGVGKK